MDCLDDHNGVIDHNGDSQKQGRKRQQVDGEAEHLQKEEGTDERNGNGNQRDER